MLLPHLTRLVLSYEVRGVGFLVGLGGARMPRADECRISGAWCSATRCVAKRRLGSNNSVVLTGTK